MRSDLAVILHKVIGNIQKEMDRISETNWGMSLEDDSCLFTVYFLNKENEVSSNEKILKELNKLKKFFSIKRTIMGNSVTVYLEVKNL